MVRRVVRRVGEVGVDPCLEGEEGRVERGFLLARAAVQPREVRKREGVARCRGCCRRLWGCGCGLLWGRWIGEARDQRSFRRVGRALRWLYPWRGGGVHDFVGPEGRAAHKRRSEENQTNWHAP